MLENWHKMLCWPNPIHNLITQQKKAFMIFFFFGTRTFFPARQTISANELAYISILSAKLWIQRMREIESQEKERKVKDYLVFVTNDKKKNSKKSISLFPSLSF